MRGLIHLEDHTGQLGFPDWVSRDPHNMGEFVAEMIPDHALEALDALTKSQKDPSPGYRPSVRMRPPKATTADDDHTT